MLSHNCRRFYGHRSILNKREQQMIDAPPRGRRIPHRLYQVAEMPAGRRGHAEIVTVLPLSLVNTPH